jgi:osmotically-inducible protein OsmY
MAEDVARSSRGVRNAENMLVVDLIDEVEDEAVCQRIQEALAQARGLRDMHLRVAVSGGDVVVAGQVLQLWQKETVERVVQRFRPLRLSNEITVTGK